jgi:hypothetical protein
VDFGFSALASGLLKDHGWLCTAAMVWNVLLRAAARMSSVFAACRDLANGPSDQAVLNALIDGMPKTLRVLERRLSEALTAPLPRRLTRPNLTPRLERLRFRRMLDWIAQTVVALLHDGSTPYVGFKT